MFDIGWTELLVIGVVALIVVGPKDLPAMFRTLGQFTAKARSMAREFQRAMEDAADESGVKDVGADLKKMTSARNLGLDKLQDAAKGWDTRGKDKDKDKASRPKGPETQKLSEERAEAARKIHDTAARNAAGRRAAEAAKAAGEPKPSEAAAQEPDETETVGSEAPQKRREA